MKERIQKVLGNAGVASRRKVEELVLQGRVCVNGKALRELPILIDPEVDKITVDDEPIRLGARRRSGPSRTSGRSRSGGTAHGPVAGDRLYYLLNKPRGVHTTNVAQGVQTLAIDLLPPDLPGRLYPVGRLDAESKGLLLLTNDGELTYRLTHPRYGVPRTYRATVDGAVSPPELQELERGVWLSDPHGGKGFKTARCQIEIVKRLPERSILDITLREGRNAQIRRMLAKLGHKVRDITRIRLGPLTLEGLKPGQSRPLTPREIRALRAVKSEKGKVKNEGKGEGVKV